GEHPARGDNKQLKRAFFLAAFASLSDPTSRAYYDPNAPPGRSTTPRSSAWPDAASTSCTPCSATAPSTRHARRRPLDETIGTPPGRATRVLLLVLRVVSASLVWPPAFRRGVAPAGLPGGITVAMDRGRLLSRAVIGLGLIGIVVGAGELRDKSGVLGRFLLELR